MCLSTVVQQHQEVIIWDHLSVTLCMLPQLALQMDSSCLSRKMLYSKGQLSERAAQLNQLFDWGYYDKLRTQIYKLTNKIRLTLVGEARCSHISGVHYCEEQQLALAREIT